MTFIVGVQDHEEPGQLLLILAQEHCAAIGIASSGAKRKVHQLRGCTARGGWRRSDQCSPRSCCLPFSSVSLEQQAYFL
uniref:Uncharacterized protein n=1 Tax=Triticum urartu TaxID=4572 RepID=A0A8R7U9P1_TRIUA